MSIYLDSNSKKFCKEPIELIENFENAKNDLERTWVLHHRLELTMDDDFAHSAEELKRLGMYFNRPAFELIFLTKNEHMRKHLLARNPNSQKSVRLKKSLKMRGNKNACGIIRSEEYKDKFRGESNPAKRPEVRKKISESLRSVLSK